MQTILIIDDNKDIRENIAEILSLAGFKTLVAENGKKGIDLALSEKPTLIICDIMMPELDGYGVLHLLQRNVETKFIPFIFLTAKTEYNDYRKGMEMGADDYITKPLDDIQLLSAIETKLKKYDILHKKYSNDIDGANKLMKDLCDSGMLDLNTVSYESEVILKKNFLYAENKHPRCLYFLKKGKVKTYKITEDGKIYINNFYTEGDFIGYQALLENKIYDDNAEVLEEAEVIMIPKSDFIAAISNDMTIASKFIKLISNKVKDQEERLMDMAYSSLRQRIAKALVSIQEKLNKNDDQIIDIPRHDIARYVGTATASLIRTLSDFKQEKLIDIKEGKIRILNSNGLSGLLY